MTPCYSLQGPVEVAISCVIPACLNTNIQTPQLQNKPGKELVRKALHCVLELWKIREAVQMGSRIGSLVPGEELWKHS